MASCAHSTQHGAALLSRLTLTASSVPSDQGTDAWPGRGKVLCAAADGQPVEACAQRLGRGLRTGLCHPAGGKAPAHEAGGPGNGRRHALPHHCCRSLPDAPNSCAASVWALNLSTLPAQHCRISVYPSLAFQAAELRKSASTQASQLCGWQMRMHAAHVCNAGSAVRAPSYISSAWPCLAAEYSAANALAVCSRLSAAEM